MPHTLTFDLGSAKTFKSFGWRTRWNADNGRIKEYKLEISTDELAVDDESKVWTQIASGTATYEGREPKWFMLDQAYTAQYVRLTEISNVAGNNYGCAAEFYLSEQEYVTPSTDFEGFTASQMTVASVSTEDLEEGGKQVTFTMEPYTFKDPLNFAVSTWNVSMVVKMKDGEHFMKKYLQVQAADANAKATAIDYIETECLGTADVADDHKWTRDASQGGVGGMSGYTLTLGQPVYVEGMFFGSEFPQAENMIEEENAYTSRYYVGKTIPYIYATHKGQDLTTDFNGLQDADVDKDAVFETWANVTGAGSSATDLDMLRSDFYSYIEGIAKPTKLRMQYNSWYDWMMLITEERINKSFKEMERGFSQHGLRPMDSYVVDDGWNSYGVSDTDRSGSTANQTGFWEFNDKFPNGLGGASKIARMYGSGFGIWLGPRGGYNFNAAWGNLLQNSGYGTASNGEAATGDFVYIAKLKEFFTENQTNYGVNYWKLDGFATSQGAAKATDEKHPVARYIRGGKNGNYYFTEHWERWYNALAAMYETTPELWLNLTCYVNPSPWILQFCNTVWMQNSNDMYRTIVDSRSRELDKQLSYRDDRYYAFTNTQQLQFPLNHVFNHDPIYGQTDCMSAGAMNDNEFRAYLYMMATRGTAFWEMLYSYNMMNEGNKWMINAEALNFVEKNYDILRHAIYYGSTPTAAEPYGYSCWKEDGTGKVEGIVSFRNPSNSEKTCAFTLNRSVGVPTAASALKASLVMEYSGTYTNDNLSDVSALTADNADSGSYGFGDTYSVTLKAGEIRLVRFSSEADATAAAIYSARALSNSTVEVKFDEPVVADASQFALYQGDTKVADAASVTTGADYRTLSLAFATGVTLSADLPYTIRVNGTKDWVGNATTATSNAFYTVTDGVIVSVDAAADLAAVPASTEEINANIPMHTLTAATAPTNQGQFIGKAPFNVSLLVNTSETDAALVTAGSSFSLKLVGGKPVFTVGSVECAGDTAVTAGTPVMLSCSREMNGMLKIYLNGQLQKTTYDAANLNEDLAGAALSLGEDGKSVTLGQFKLRTVIPAYDAEYSTYKETLVGYGDEIAAAVAEAQAALDKTGVGYPTATPRTTLNEAITTAQEGSVYFTSTYTNLQTAIANFYASTDVNMPEDGHAYTLTLKHGDGTLRYFYYDADADAETPSPATKTAVRTEETVLPSSATWVCRKVGTKYAFVNDEGTYLLWFGGSGDGAYDSNVGYTSAYASNKNLFQVIKFTTGNNVQVGNDFLFGTLGLKGTRNSGDAPYFIIKNDGSGVASSLAFVDKSGNNYRTSAIMIEEVAYPNLVSLRQPAKTDGRIYASLALPFSSVVPEGLTAYHATLNSNSSGTYLQLAALDGGIVPAGLPVVLRKEGTATEEARFLPVTDETVPTDLEASALSAVFKTTARNTDATTYVLSGAFSTGIGFYPYTADDLPTYKAYLEIGATEATGLRAVFFDADELTGVGNVTLGEQGSTTVVDLSGRRLTKPAGKGVYIQNGKKFIVR
ncbi:MAG: discoidin domain-containing protein [Alloprevotella sp.]